MTVQRSNELSQGQLGRTSLPEKIGFVARSNYSMLRLLAILCAVVLAGHLLSGGIMLRPENIQNVLQQNSQLLIVVTAQFLVVATGGIDLSVGAVLALSSVIFVGLLPYGAVIATCGAVLSGAIFGLVNGLLVSLVRLPAFVVTLGTMQIGYSLSRLYSGGGTTAGTSMEFPVPAAMLEFYAGRFLGIPLPVWLAVTVLIATTFYLRTSIGHFIFAVGGNSRAARMAGISVSVVQIAAYATASAITAIAGVVFTTRVGYGDPGAGLWMPLDSIAAVSIGGVSLTGGRGSALSGFLGVLILAVVDNVMNLVGVPVTLQPVVKGAVVVATVYIYSRRQE